MKPRNCIFLFSLLFMVSWQFSASAAPSNNRNWRRPANRHCRSFSFRRHRKLLARESFRSSRARASDGIDCNESEDTAPGDERNQPFPEGNISSDSTSDIDDSDGALDDLSADTSTRNYQNTQLFSVTDLDAITLRAPRIVPILLFPVSCFYCLHEHIRERAPPTLRLNM
jgi:hypothetical protein